MGEVRFYGGRVASEGLVEIFLNDQWGALCTSSFGREEGIAVCKQMGYSMLVAFAKEQMYVIIVMSCNHYICILRYKSNSNVTWTTNITCPSNQVCISKCLSTTAALGSACQKHQYVSIKCGKNLCTCLCIISY